MAAKQGLTAQLSQAGEDAKRAVLSRTGVKSSWFSNLNTVCTIKSAPPRSPEVLQMLATRSGWLYKRNEQHVWQARWCCVVPHMFLYYFDANIGAGSEAPTKMQQNPSTEQQEAWNRAVRKGYGNRKQHEKRSSLYLFNQGTSSAALRQETGNEVPDDLDDAPAVSPDSTKFSTLQPSGIIDLECYSSVHRSTHNELVLELAGDDTVNPDLRAFYFCAANEEDCESWTSALLNGRNAALVDECEAYKQVCDGFASQLQMLHSDLGRAQLTASEAQDELYRVRSQAEGNRRATLRSMEDACVHRSSCSELENKRIEFRANLEKIRSQDLGVQAAVRVLLEYSKGVEELCEKLYEDKKHLESDLQATGQSDSAKVQDLSLELDEMRRKFEQEKKQWQSQLETATAKYSQSQKDLQGTKMEIFMFQTQQRNKIAELQQREQILKKEVIDLRTKLENSNLELGVLRHKEEKRNLHAEQERALLERYVEKIESQVKVQQNVMEMMSANGSVYGGGSGPVAGYEQSPGRRNVVYVRAADDGQRSEQDDDGVVEGLVPIPNALPRGRSVAEDDNRSHVSELTEDRTQRHFEAFQHNYSRNGEVDKDGPRSQTKLSLISPRAVSPAVIGFQNNDYQQTSASTTPVDAVKPGGSLPPIGLPPRSDTRVREQRDSMSASGNSKRKMSVAERARLAADRQSTPVRVTVDDSVVKEVEEAKRSQSPFVALTSPEAAGDTLVNEESTSLVHRMSAALLGLPDVLSDDDDDSIYSTRVTDYSDATTQVHDRQNLSLAERMEMQRQVQLKFLQDKGLIRDPSELRGGAGSSVAGDDASSVASSTFSRTRSTASTKNGQNL